jgi:hypothetical protein
MLCTSHQIFCLGDQIKKSDMGRACSTFGGDEKCI